MVAVVKSIKVNNYVMNMGELVYDDKLLTAG